MSVIDYIMITCNLKNGRVQITSDYMKKCNRLQLITITITIIPSLSRIMSGFIVSTDQSAMRLINLSVSRSSQ